MTSTTPTQSLATDLTALADDCAELRREIYDGEIDLATTDAVQIGALVAKLLIKIADARADARDAAEAEAEAERAHRRSESLTSIFL